MGSLNKTSLNRIRDNQRRSRARHKEYVQRLEERLRLCESKGIEAAFEIQHAARKVVEENRKCRALLNSLGFDNQRIDYYLQTGSLTCADTTIPGLLDDQSGMVQSLELLLAPRRPPPPGSKPQSTSSAPDAVVFNAASDNAVDPPTHNQAKPENHPTKVNKHIQSSCDLARCGQNALEPETRGYTGYLGSSALPSHHAGEPQQHSPGIVQQTEEPRHIQAISHVACSDSQDVMYYEQDASLEQHPEREPSGDLYLSLPATLRKTGYSIPDESFFPSLLRQRCEYSDCAYTAQCVNIDNTQDIVASLSLPNETCRLIHMDIPSFIGGDD
ncbi:hypothetical protein GGR54DRAFT_144620 [Hypoxylon sp. NC1633]|nr:hypothetical protein GGR54DRAFT_144620 [Hypoxylon sp. NC1633]